MDRTIWNRILIPIFIGELSFELYCVGVLWMFSQMEGEATAWTVPDVGKLLNLCRQHPRRQTELFLFVYLHLKTRLHNHKMSLEQRWELSVSYLAGTLSHSCLFACQTNQHLGTWCCWWRRWSSRLLSPFFPPTLACDSLCFFCVVKGYNPKFIISLQPAFCL